ncbi:hypothetical protein QTP86_017593 [Hemibagrus guttatus]|nr:hypothetical protein QTP86_017593 [Hemibagrus guttatus]
MGLGAALMQRDQNGRDVAVAYASRALHKSEKPYSTPEKECLAIIWALEHFRPYVEGLHVTIFTDHSGLKWLMSRPNPTGRLARWSLRLQDFDFNIVHKPGSRKKVPDALSRNPLTDNESPMDLLPDYAVIGGLDLRTLPSVALMDRFHVRKLQLDDPITGDLIRKMEAELRQDSEIDDCSQYSIQDGLLYFHDPKTACGIHPLKSLKLYAPASLRSTLLRYYHDHPMAGHLGITKTLARLKLRFFWPKMASEWVEIVAVREATAQVAANKLLSEVFSRHGAPTYLISDRGSPFVSDLFERVLAALGTEHRLTTAYHPQTNATERVNRTLKTAIRAYVDDKHTTWDRYIPQICFALRTAPHENTGQTPSMMLYGRELDTSLDLVTQPVWDGMEEPEVSYSEHLRLSLREAHDHARAALDISHERRKLHYDKRRRSVSYAIGDLVRVKTHPKSDALANFTAKLAPLYSGPYRVTRVLSGVNYRLAKLDTGEDAGVFSCGDTIPVLGEIHTWSWATAPWERIHVDYAEVNKQHFLVVIDVHSKWIEVLPTKLTTAEKTANLLRNLFASYGLPKVLVSDNGPQFTAPEFEKFLKENGVRHVLSPPYHPASNGAAERAVQTFKKASIRLQSQSTSPNQQLARFLFTYRNIPHTVTERTPAELFLKRQPRTRLSLIKPNVSDVVSKHQIQQQKAHDKKSKSLRTFSLGERVLVRDFRHPKKLWIPGTILQCTGPLTYCVQVGHRKVKVHVDHMLPSRSSDQQREGITEDMFDCLPVGGMQRAVTSDPEGSMYIEKNRGPKTEPCGTPYSTGITLDISPFKSTKWYRSDSPADGSGFFWRWRRTITEYLATHGSSGAAQDHRATGFAHPCFSGSARSAYCTAEQRDRCRGKRPLLAPGVYREDGTKCAFLLSLLMGKALEWASAVWDADPLIRASYSHFEEGIREVFEHPSGGKDISVQLMEICQGSESATDYAIRFRTLAAQSEWNDAALWAMFRAGLNPTLQTELACNVEATSLSQFVATAICLDNLGANAGPGPPHGLRPPRVRMDCPGRGERDPDPCSGEI